MRGNKRGNKMPLPDIVIMLRRGADELHAGLHAKASVGERAALGNTIVHAGPDDAQGERQARRAAASGNAPYRGATVSSASGI